MLRLERTILSSCISTTCVFFVLHYCPVLRMCILEIRRMKAGRISILLSNRIRHQCHHVCCDVCNWRIIAASALRQPLWLGITAMFTSQNLTTPCQMSIISTSFKCGAQSSTLCMWQPTLMSQNHTWACSRVNSSLIYTYESLFTSLFFPL